MHKLLIVHNTIDRQQQNLNPLSNVVTIETASISSVVNGLQATHGANLHSVWSFTEKRYLYKAPHTDRKANVRNRITQPPSVYNQTVNL